MFDSDYTENDDFCVVINVINSSEDHFVKSHKDFQDISFQYAFACGKYSGGQTCVFSTYGKRHWDIDYKYFIYRMKEIEKLVSKLKERNQARTKRGRNVFNTQLYLMMRQSVNTKGLNGFTKEHNFVKGKGVFMEDVTRRLDKNKREI